MLNNLQRNQNQVKICVSCAKKYENGYRVEWKLTRPSVSFYCSLNCASRHWNFNEKGLFELKEDK